MKAARITLCIAALCITGAASAQYQYKGITPSNQSKGQSGYQPPNYPVPNVRGPGYGGDSRPATGIRPAITPNAPSGMGTRPGAGAPSSNLPNTSGMGNRPALGTPRPSGPGLRVPGMGN